MLAVERGRSCARLASASADVTQRAAQAIQDKLSVWGEKHATIPVEEYMLASLVGKNGTAILGLQKELKVGIQLNRHSAPMQLEIDASDKSTLDAAMLSLTDKVKKMRRGHWHSTVGPELIGLLVGKQGAKINKLRSDTGEYDDSDDDNCFLTLITFITFFPFDPKALVLTLHSNYLSICLSVCIRLSALSVCGWE